MKAREQANKDLVRDFVQAHAPGLRVVAEVVLWLRRVIGALAASWDQFNWENLLTAFGSDNLASFQAALSTASWNPGLS
jgi:hypothetical protein